MQQKILIGKILSAHGIKGEMKVLLFLDDVKNIEKYQIFDEKNKIYKINLASKKSVKVLASKAGDKVVIAKIDNIENRDDAEKLRGTEIFTYRENFAKTKKNEFYIADLVGLDVVNPDKQKLGKVLNVLDFGASPLIEIEFLDEFIPQSFQKIANFPFKNEFFGDVDIENGYMIFNAPDAV